MDQEKFKEFINRIDFKYCCKIKFNTVDSGDLTNDQKVAIGMKIIEGLKDEIGELTKESGEVEGVCESCSLPIYESQPHMTDIEGVPFHKNGDCDSWVTENEVGEF